MSDQARLAVVTGSTRGIGAAIIHRLHEDGFATIGIGRTVLEDHQGAKRTIECDLTNDQDIERACGEILKRGVPAVLVNNAGTFVLELLENTTVPMFDRMLRTNVLAPFQLLRALVPLMAKQRGHLVTIGSIADYRVFPGNAAYAASKRAVRAMHDVVAEEYRGRLRTTLISPGPTDTTLWDPFSPDDREDLPSRSAMLEPNDVADAVSYAVSRPITVNVDLIRLNHSGLS